MSDKIARPIGRADMEFYEAAIVRRMALILSGYSETEWDALSHRTKNRWLDRAVSGACDLFNDSSVAARLPLLSKRLAA